MGTQKGEAQMDWTQLEAAKAAQRLLRAGLQGERKGRSEGAKGASRKVAFSRLSSAVFSF